MAANPRVIEKRERPSSVEEANAKKFIDAIEDRARTYKLSDQSLPFNLYPADRATIVELCRMARRALPK